MNTKSQIINSLCAITAAWTLFLTTVNLNAQNLFVADFSANTIYELTNNNGVLSPNLTGFSSGLNGPSGLAFDSTANLFVGNYGNGTIVKITPSGVQTTYAGGMSHPGLIAFDKMHNLFVADSGSGNIVKITTNLVVSTFATNLNAYALTFDRTGDLFAANFNNGTVYEFTNNNGTLSSNSTVFASGFNMPGSLIFDTNGNLFVGSYAGIIEVAPNGATNAFSLMRSANGLAFDNAGNLFSTYTEYLIKTTPGGAQSVFTSSFTSAVGLAFQPSVTPPALNIASAGNQVAVFWPSGAGSYILQQTTNLTNPNWSTVTNGAPIVGVTITNSSPNHFFRLTTP
jgi:sugar lactone lactonase YvrE